MMDEMEEGYDKLKFKEYVTMVSTIKEDDLCFQQVECQNMACFMIDLKEELWTIGSSIFGQNGSGKYKNWPIPFNISRFHHMNFKKVSCSDTNTSAISDKGKLYIWGENKFGLNLEGFENQQYLESPAKIKKKHFLQYFLEEDSETLKTFQHVSLSKNMVLTVCNDKLFSFGKEEKGRLGAGLIEAKITKEPVIVRFPQQIYQVSGIAIGKNHCLCWNLEGKIFSWGDGSEGKLGVCKQDGSYNFNFISPIQIKLLEKYRIVQGACGESHSCVLTSQGQIFTFGRTIYNKFKKLDNLYPEFYRPKKLRLLSKQKKEIENFVVKIKTNKFQNAAIDNKGFLYTWGENTQNSLGHISVTDLNSPVCVEELTNQYVIDIGLEQNYSVVICSQTQDNLSYKNLTQIIENKRQDQKKKSAHVIWPSDTKKPYFIQQEQRDKKIRKHSSIDGIKPNFQVKKEVLQEINKVKSEHQFVKFQLQERQRNQQKILEQKPFLKWEQKKQKHLKKKQMDYLSIQSEKNNPAPYFCYVDGQKLDFDTASTKLNLDKELQYQEEENQKLEKNFRSSSNDQKQLQTKVIFSPELYHLQKV
ncbi:Regulator of chromosome condensation 1/beta-lactamase-inhibitor protein II [Pseudocohnilembus persalinus]|uniref:Regulator of chromosome condensation 1/beta-lactamase-inhibitor protein II n=1 Tax=Pseudocohnilembus persalinus TaxID=266149 RepID=A0A0V0QPN5_PSEPJ|nr:Regulator of chromosome condensation 1/beta-lactamase-inhibitor protein II [Pseudocohnilembus persalinus]|eukprot:KRX03968.1 Regulator of chromosome condensation 1/beta-lactamase-inhibitor protein II [Pseudocohnilembus persalinus]